MSVVPIPLNRLDTFEEENRQWVLAHKNDVSVFLHDKQLS